MYDNLYKQFNPDNFDPSEELIEMMAHTVSQDGNFVMNFGPKADGTFRQKELDDVRQIGEWMEINGDAIYECGYAGWEKQDWGYFTKKAGKDSVYMIVFNIPVTGKLRVKPVKTMQIVSAFLINKPHEKLKSSKMTPSISTCLRVLNLTSPLSLPCRWYNSMAQHQKN